MELADKINYVYDQVVKSKFGCIFFKVIDDKIVPIDRVNQPGDNIVESVRQNGTALEVFRTCLLATLGMKFEYDEKFPGDDWKDK